MPTLLRTWGLALCLLVGALAPAAAQEACTPDGNVLGVSRTVEIDTTSGPRFGAQYGEQTFLADGEVVLTFDDGPIPAHTKAVLEALAAQCTKATFFLVGRMAVAYPDMVQEYDRRGHTVGTHTWSHANLKKLTPLKARTEIELGFSAVQQAMGKPIAPFFRFPYLSDTKATTIHMQERHVAIFSIDVDSKDFRTRDPGTVHRKVMADLARHRKGIILFHDIQPSTAHALPGLLADLKAKGYRVVHMVPKAPVESMAEFDLRAREELDKRRRIVVSQPMAKRTLTWPASPAPPVRAAVAEASAAPAPVVKPTLRPTVRSDDEWFMRILRP